MSYARKSFASHALGNTDKSGRKSVAAPLSSRKSTISGTGRLGGMTSLPDIKHHETKLLALAPQLLPSFLQSTQFNGVVPTPFTPKNLRREEFFNIFSHIMRQIDPAFKFGATWEMEFELFAKSYGYPFSIPTKSAMASFEVSESTRRAVVLYMVWLVQFIMYYNDTYSPETGYYLHHNITTIQQDVDENEDLDNITTFLLVRKSYHEWLRSGDDNCIAKDLISTSKQTQVELHEEITSLTKQHTALNKSIQQYDNIQDEIARLQKRIGSLTDAISKEDEMIMDCQSKFARINGKIVEKENIWKQKEQEINTSQQVINNINILLNQQTQSEEDLRNLRKTQLLLQQKSEQLTTLHVTNTTDINTLQATITEQLQTIRSTVDEIHSLYHQYKHDFEDFHTHEISKQSTDPKSSPIYPIKLLNIPQISENDMNAYIQPSSKTTTDVNEKNKISQEDPEYAPGNDNDNLLTTPTIGKSQKSPIIHHISPILQKSATTRTLPVLFQQIPPNSIQSTSQQYFQSKRVLSTNIFTFHQDHQRLDETFAFEEDMNIKLSDTIANLQKNIKEYVNAMQSSETKHNTEAQRLDEQRAQLETELQHLQQSDDVLANISNECKQLQFAYQRLQQQHELTEQQYSDILIKICWEVGEHLSHTHVITRDTFKRGKDIKDTITKLVHKHNAENW